MARADRMPERGSVDPLFDGHLERPLLDLSPEERLDWIWEMMELVRVARPERLPEGARQLRPGWEAPLGVQPARRRGPLDEGV